MGALDGRVVVVTGAGRGIGRAHAVELAAHGAAVLVNNRSAEPAHAVVEGIRARGGDAEADVEDVGSWEGARRLIAHAVERCGRLDGLVNNAGNVVAAPIADTDEAMFDESVAVHVKGTYAPTRFALEHWRERSRAGDPAHAGGSIVNTISETGLHSVANLSTYGLCKAAVLNITRTTSLEGAEYGVRANAVGPQGLTRMWLGDPVVGLPADTVLLEADEYTEPSPTHPGNSSPIVAWLMSDAAADVSGQVIRTMGVHVGVCREWTSSELVPPTGGRPAWSIADIDAAVRGLLGADTRYVEPREELPDQATQ
jgi:NAD(P)-dependent dehydrogenase (short-subunit alcohol dehydrogenase family)